MTDPENLFMAKAENLSKTMGNHGGMAGFMVPEYQRTYDWETDKIQRLLEDCLAGFDNCWHTREAASYTFLGTIILVNERHSKEPSFDGASLAIVDGQQRLTTLSILCCVLVEALLRHQDEIHLDGVRSLREPTRQWLKREIHFHMIALSDCVIGRLRERGRDYPFPRVVRRNDTRASNAMNAEYRSVVGKFLKEFAQFFDGEQQTFEPRREPDSAEASRFFRSYDFIKDQIELAICRVNEGASRFALDYDREGRQAFEGRGVKRLFEKLDTDQSAADRAVSEVGNAPPVAPLVRLIAFASYVTKCVILTRVETDDVNCAFDIFDSLNTTGEPLTAIETFRPRVIQFEDRMTGYGGSDCEYSLSRLATHLDQVFVTASARQRAVKELLVSFALYMDGHRLGFPLNAQRTYLRNAFDGYGSSDAGIAQRRRFVGTIADIAEFRDRYWRIENIRSLDSDHTPYAVGKIKLCFSFVSAMRTSLALPLLARYWLEWRDDRIPESEFQDAAKAVTAFIVLRRTLTGGTANIDAEFRRLMRDVPSVGGRPFACGKDWSNPLPTVAELKRELTGRYLRRQYEASDRDAWVERASSVEVARRSQPLCRFLLLAASHNAMQSSIAGLLTRDDVVGGEQLDYLNFTSWESPLYATLEHVAPDSDSRGAWDSTIYTDGSRHTLGNLVLLPDKENASIGNAEWGKKKLYYRALAAATMSERRSAIEAAQAQGLSFGRRATEVLRNNEQLRMLEGIHTVDEWNREFIENRTRRLLGLVWDQLWPWLNE